MSEVINAFFWPLLLLLIDSKLQSQGILVLFYTVEVFSFFYIISILGMKDVVAGLIKSRIIKNQNKSAYAIKRTAFMFQIAVSFLVSVLMCAFSSFIANSLFNLPQCRFLIIIMSVYFFIFSINEVLSAFFKGNSNAVYSNIISILRPISIYIFSIIYINTYTNRANEVNALLRQDFSEMYKCMGIIIAAIIAEIVILLISVLLSLILKLFKKKNNSQSLRNAETFDIIIPIIISNRVFPIFKSLLFKLPLWSIMILFAHNRKNISLEEFSVILYPLLPMMFLLSESFKGSFKNLSGELKNAYRNKENRTVKHFYSAAFTLLLSFSIFMILISFVLRKNISLVFYKVENEHLLKYITVFTLFMAAYAIISLFIDYMNKCEMDREIYLILLSIDVVNIILNMVFIKNKPGLDSIINATTISLLVGALAVTIIVLLKFKLRIKPLKNLLTPLICAFIAAAICKLFITIFTPHLPYIITLLCSFIMAALIYLVLIIYLNVINGKNVEFMPAFKFLNMLGEILGVY